MISRVLYQLEANGSAEEGSPADLLDLLDRSVWVWLDVSDPDSATIDFLATEVGVDPATIEDIKDIELLPKYEDNVDQLYCVFHSLIAVDDAVDTAEVDCVLKGNLLITLHDLPLVGVDALWELAERHPRAVGCSDASVVLARLGELIGRRYLEVITTLDRRFIELTERALEVDPVVLAEVQHLRRDETTIRMMVNPQRQLLASLRSEPLACVSDAGRQRFGDAYDIHNQLVETLGTARQLFTDVLDTYHGASAEKLNEVTRVLTVYAAIMLPLSIVVGFFGMNFENLPGTDSENGWIVVTALMALFAVVSWAVFVRRGFLGGPKLSTARQRVTRGLVTAARAPTKPLALLRRDQHS